MKRFSELLPMKHLEKVAIPAFGIGIIGVTVFLGEVLKEPYEFNPERSAVVVDIQREPVEVDDYYAPIYMGHTEPASITLKQCDIDKPANCDTDAFRLDSAMLERVAHVDIGDVVVLDLLRQDP